MQKENDHWQLREFHELIKVSDQNEIENQGDMLETFLQESSRQLQILEQGKLLREKVQAQMKVFVDLCEDWCKMGKI